MATRGPKPTPKNLRLVKGTDRKDRVNDDEPDVKICVPDAPEYLDPEQQIVFLDTARKLARMRVMSDADVDALAIYAVAHCEMIEAQKMVSEMGLMVRAPKTHVPMHNPYLSIRDKATKTALGILTEFGLTPSSRTRIKTS